MTDVSTLNTNTSLRGPLLAAHRELRKAVAARCAQLKGECSAAHWARRQAGLAVPGEGVLRYLHLSQALNTALAEFGGPKLIPETSGFGDYLLAQRRKVQDGSYAAGSEVNIFFDMEPPPGTDEATVAAARAKKDKAMAAWCAWKEFAELFDKSFGALLPAAGPGPGATWWA
jgi:hypothetical protein